MADVAASSSCGDANASLVPDTNKQGTDSQAAGGNQLLRDRKRTHPSSHRPSAEEQVFRVHPRFGTEPGRFLDDRLKQDRLTIGGPPPRSAIGKIHAPAGVSGNGESIVDGNQCGLIPVGRRTGREKNPPPGHLSRLAEQNPLRLGQFRDALPGSIDGTPMIGMSGAYQPSELSQDVAPRGFRLCAEAQHFQGPMLVMVRAAPRAVGRLVTGQIAKEAIIVVGMPASGPSEHPEGPTPHAV